MTTTRWWLLRHAPVINPERRIYGQGDIEADTTEGEPFRRLAETLPRGAVWLTTHLRRTQQTASAIRAAWSADDPPPEPAVIPDLAEQHFGSWQGMTHAELGARQPRAAHRFWLAPAAERPPGGESFVDVIGRVAGALAALTLEHSGRDIVAVVHGGPIRAALGHALALDPEAALRFRIDTLSLTRLDAIPLGTGVTAWRVEGVNLPPGAFPPPPPAPPA